MNYFWVQVNNYYLQNIGVSYYQCIVVFIYFLYLANILLKEGKAFQNIYL